MNKEKNNLKAIKKSLKTRVRIGANIPRKQLLKIFSFLKSSSLEKKLLIADDFPLFNINPGHISKCVKHGFKPNSFISFGNWDTEGADLISEVRPGLYSTVQDLFLHEKNYKNTAQYRMMIDSINLYQQGMIKDPAKKGGYWCKTENDVDIYFDKLIKSYENIKKNGYKSQSQLRKDNFDHIIHSKDEIRVYISRRGELILGYGGTHRLLISKLLKLDRIIVRLEGVHEEFLNDNRKEGVSVRSFIQQYIHNQFL